MAGRYPSNNKLASEGSPRKLLRNRQPQNPKTPKSGIVPTALTAAFDHPGIAGAIRKFVFETMQKGIAGLRREFAVLRSTPDQNSKVPIDSTTASKFRYKDVFCTDKSRVILTFLPSFGDFIHANWLKSEFMENSFICCQGPLTDTCGDFWRMIYQEKVYHIFMLCRCEEMGKAKCHQYWPKNPGETFTFYGLITVKNEGVTENDSDICTTNLTLTYDGEKRKIEHRQWNTWPDKSVPRNPVPAFKLIHLARTSRYPVCVHCSAGIGRTGTLVALELLQRNFMHSVEPSVPQIVLEIRSQRAQAVQTEDQLVWIYFVMLGKLCYHGLMAQQDYKLFHAEYEEYIRSMGGQQPILPSFPKESAVPVKPSGENITQPPAVTKGKTRRRPRTQRKRKASSNKDEDNGILLLGPSTAATQAGTPPAGSSSSGPDALQQQQQPPRRRSAPNAISGSKNNDKSQRRRRKAKEVNKQRQDEGLVPAQVGGRLAVAEELPQQLQQRNYQTLQQQQRPTQKPQPIPAASQAPILSAVAKQDEENDTARSDRPPQFKPSSERPQAPSYEDHGNNVTATSAENVRKKSDEEPNSVFLQPNLASEQKKQFFAVAKPNPNGPAPPPTKDDNSYYADASDQMRGNIGGKGGKPGTPAKFDDNGYFAAPKK